MDHIETKILNSYTIQKAAQNMVFAARLTQQGHCIQNMGDLMALYQKSFTDRVSTAGGWMENKFLYSP